MDFTRSKIKFRQFADTLRHEYRYIFTDAGVILVVIGAIFIYATAYSLAYKNEVLRDVPIAVVDNDMTPSSRKLVRAMDAAENLKVAYKPSDLGEAERLFFDRKIFGVVVIPGDMERKVMRMEKVDVAVYADAGYFLIYRQVFFDVTGAIMSTGGELEWIRFVSKGLSPMQAKTLADPVSATIINTYNPYGGYATFIVPAIIMVIIQQTLLIGIGMVGGTWRERGMYRSLCPVGEKRLSVIPIVLGKAAAYVSIYCITLVYILGFHYKIFGYPENGTVSDLLLFLIPYLLSCTFLGIALSSLFKYRENSLLWMLFTSIPFLLLSGASIPEESMPAWLYELGKIIPSSSGVDGFIRIRTMGATIGEVSSQYATLWLLTFVYFFLACVGMRRVIIRNS